MSNVIKVMNKRKGDELIGAAYKRISKRVADSPELVQVVLDNL